jgi:hypothetical protein
MPAPAAPGAAVSRPRSDLATVIAVAVVAYAVAALLHEGVGHGGACLLVGGVPKAVSTTYFDCGEETLARAAQDFVSAGGTLMNLLAGLAFWALLHLARRAAPPLRLFLWLAMTVNLLSGGGYFLFSGVAGIGDWAAIVHGREPVWLWRGSLTLLGGVCYALFVWIALREFARFVGGTPPERAKRANRLAWTVYLTGGLLSCLAGLLNPLGMYLVAISAAAFAFGGTSGLAWMMQMLENPRLPKPAAPPFAVARSWGWIVAGALTLAIFVGVFGPSVAL